MWADDVTVGRPAPSPSRSRAKLVDDDLFAHGPPPAARKPASDPVFAAPASAPASAPAPAPRGLPPRADNDPVIGVSRSDRDDDRAAREAFFREVLERETAPRAADPFEQGRFAHERRTMLAAVMGGRR
jgi:hypothetical protein